MKLYTIYKITNGKKELCVNDVPDKTPSGAVKRYQFALYMANRELINRMDYTAELTKKN